MGKFNSAKSSQKFLETQYGIPKKRKRVGNVSRRLQKNKRLAGADLESALRVSDEKTAEKLKNGELLDDFEKHVIIDLLQKRSVL